MAFTFSESILDAFQTAADKIGIESPITWSNRTLIGVTVFVLSSTFLLFRLLSQKLDAGRLSKSRVAKEKVPRIVVKPQDGTVKVAEILMHPIKSCRGTSVQTARYTPEGLENDRRWCIIDAATKSVITAREFPRMILISPRVEVDPSSAHGGSLIVGFPPDAPAGCTEIKIPLQPTEETLRGWEMLENFDFMGGANDGYIVQSLNPQEPTASTILSLYFAKPVHLLYKGPKPRQVDTTFEFPTLQATSVFQDMYPLLVLSKESTDDVEREIRPRVGTQGIEQVWSEKKVEVRRFRPNIVLEGAGPFAEDDWEEMAIGSPDAPTITLVSKCTRCLLPNVNPATGIRDNAIPYKVIMKFRTGLDPILKNKPCVGCNGVPAKEGIVNVGDVVYVKKMIGE